MPSILIKFANLDNSESMSDDEYLKSGNDEPIDNLIHNNKRMPRYSRIEWQPIDFSKPQRYDRLGNVI